LSAVSGKLSVVTEEAIANLKEATELYLEGFPIPETSPRINNYI
jgi:predicted RNase H-like HicB family nuclease